jgi:uncharacterized protein YndB with AHSA1/START domain
MKTLTYNITINKSRDYVFNTLTDKSIYPEWSKAWGDGMTYKGEWKKGGEMSFIDDSQGGTKVILEEFKPHEYIKARHIAMVDADNNEKELEDDMMKKWIGSLEEYFFKIESNEITNLEIIMTVDKAFQEMFDTTWPKALKYFKVACEK